MKTVCAKFIIPILLCCFSQILQAQQNDSTKVKTSVFGGAVTVQTKGISTVPNLTLGKPAIVFDMSMGRRLTFEPQFRFSLEGKPWAIVFWWRYKLLTGYKLSIDVRANSSLSFKNTTDTSSGTSQDVIRATRYMAGTIFPNFQINKYLNFGLFLFYTRGIEKYITRNTWMVAFRPAISNIPITKNIVARLVPEMYYLKMDEKDGIFLNTALLISMKNFPLSISALINKPLESDIPSELDFLWNVGLSYTFNKTYVEKR